MTYEPPAVTLARGVISALDWGIILQKLEWESTVERNRNDKPLMEAVMRDTGMLRKAFAAYLLNFTSSEMSQLLDAPDDKSAAPEPPSPA